MPIQQQEATNKSNLEQLKTIYTPNLGVSSIYHTSTSNILIKGCLQKKIKYRKKITKSKKINITSTIYILIREG